MLPGIVATNNNIYIQNVITAYTTNHRELSKFEPITDVDYNIVAARGVAAYAQAPAQTYVDYNNRWLNSRQAVIAAYNAAWDALAVTLYQDVQNRDQSVQGLGPVITAMQADCAVTQTTLSQALATERDTSNQLILDASGLLATTPPTPIQAALFDRGQLYLNLRYFDLALPQMDQVVLNAITLSNNRQVSALNVIRNSVIVRINVGRSVTKAANIAAVNAAVAGFQPPGTLATVANILSSVRPGAQTSIDGLRQLPATPDAVYRQAVIAFLNDYTQNANTAYANYQSTINSNFLAAVQTISNVIGPTAPPAPATTP